MCFSCFSNDIFLVFLAVCAGIKDIYSKVNFLDLTVWRKIKDSFYNCKKTIFPTSFLSLLLVCRHQKFVQDVCYVAVARQQPLQWLVIFRLAKILLGYIVTVGVPASLLKYQFAVRVCPYIRSCSVFLGFPSQPPRCNHQKIGGAQVLALLLLLSGHHHLPTARGRYGPAINNDF